MEVKVRYHIRSKYRTAYGRVETVSADSLEDAMALIRASVSGDAHERDASNTKPVVEFVQLTALEGAK